MDHVTLNFDNNISTTAVSLDFENAFDERGHLGYLRKLSKLKFSINLIKFIFIFCILLCMLYQMHTYGPSTQLIIS
jgi:hypothetical protein